MKTYCTKYGYPDTRTDAEAFFNPVGFACNHGKGLHGANVPPSVTPFGSARWVAAEGRPPGSCVREGCTCAAYVAKVAP